MNLNIDWVIAMTVFILLLAWSFAFYANLFKNTSQPIASAADAINDKVIDFLSTDTYDITVRYNTSDSVSAAKFCINITWPEGTRNSTQVYLNSTRGNNLTCNITDGILYWTSDVVKGDNYFLVHMSNISVDLNCTSTQLQLNIYSDGINQTVPWVMEKETLFSQTNINKLDSQHANYVGYESFKTSHGIERDFRIEIGNSTSVITYGPSLPLNTPVYSMERFGRIDETSENINITVMVW